MGKPVAVGKDMSTCFYLAMATRTLGALCREKALSELPNGSMVKDGSSHPGTQGDRLANKWKPAPTFRETLPLPLLFSLVTVVKGASSTAGWSTAISVSRDGSWGKLGP